MIDKNKKYTLRNGKEVVIYAIYPDGKFDNEVHGAVKSSENKWEVMSWNINGSYLKHSDNHQHDLIEVSPYANLKIDDKVLVWDNSIEEIPTKKKAHFAGINPKGNPMVWYGTGTSFTERNTTPWDHCEPYTETEPNT